MPEGQLLGDDAAAREARDVGRADVECPQDAGGVVRHHLDGDRSRGPGGPPVPPAVERRQPVPVSQPVQLELSRFDGVAQTADEEYVGALAHLLRVDLDAVGVTERPFSDVVWSDSMISASFEGLVSTDIWLGMHGLDPDGGSALVGNVARPRLPSSPRAARRWRRSAGARSGPDRLSEGLGAVHDARLRAGTKPSTRVHSSSADCASYSSASDGSVNRWPEPG